MSEILITGMEMPKGNDVLIVDSAGTITKVNRWTGKVEATDPLKVKAQELPPHGVLKDIDVINDAIIESERLGEMTGKEAGLFKAILTNAPRVIDTTKH